MPELSALETFLAVAKTASLGAAGRELGLTQPAISARLTAIEAQTGVQLAIRTARGTQLTPAGVAVAQWADQLPLSNGDSTMGSSVDNPIIALDSLQSCRTGILDTRRNALTAATTLTGVRADRARELADKLADALAHCERLAFIVEGDLHARL